MAKTRSQPGGNGKRVSVSLPGPSKVPPCRVTKPTRTQPSRRAAASFVWRRAYTEPPAHQLQILKKHADLTAEQKHYGTGPGPGTAVLAPYLMHANLRRSIASNLRRFEITQLYCPSQPDPFTGVVSTAVYSDVVDHYLDMICHHVNTAMNRAAETEIPAYVPWTSYTWEHLAKFQGTNVNQLLGNGILEAEEWDFVRLILVSAFLYNGKVFNPSFTSRHTFGSMYYSNVPLVPSAPGHAVLIAISPLAKTIEVLNSQPPSGRAPDAKFNPMQNDDLVIVQAMEVMNKLLGAKFIPREWRIRKGKSADQGPTSDCGIWTMCSAMHAAFGYPPVPQGLDMDARRKRIACEILNNDRVAPPALPATALPQAPPAPLKSNFRGLWEFENEREAMEDPFYYPLCDVDLPDEEWVKKGRREQDGWQVVPESILGMLPKEMRERGTGPLKWTYEDE